MRLFKYTAFLFVLTLLTSCGGAKEEKKEAPIRPVQYFTVGVGDNADERAFTGTARSANEISLSFRSAGIITSVNVKVGQKVNKGDLIAKLDNIEANLAYQKSLSAVQSAKANLDKAKTDLNRLKGLYEKGSVSLTDYQGTKNAYQNSLSQYESAERNRDISKTQMEYGYIYAPKAGIIANTVGELNENVSPGHVFAVLNAGEQMKVEVGIPESVINKVNVGMKADVAFSALPGKILVGEVIEVPQILDRQASTYLVSVGITNGSKGIKAGMAAKATFNFAEHTHNSDTHQHLVVPIKAVGEDGNGNYVFLIDSEDGKIGTVKKQAIRIGEMTSSGFEIESGLTEGQKIATAGLSTLLEGQQVKLQ